MDTFPKKSAREFADRVYWLVSQIPSGAVATYGQIATYAGSPRAARAVGNLMRESFRNRRPVPWQRVINAQGGISSRGETGRAELQYELLVSEGIEFDENRHCDLSRFRWEPGEPFWGY